MGGGANANERPQQGHAAGGRHAVASTAAACSHHFPAKQAGAKQSGRSTLCSVNGARGMGLRDAQRSETHSQTTRTHELSRNTSYASRHIPLGSRCNAMSAFSTTLSTVFVPPLASHASAQTPAALNTHPTTSCRIARSVLSSRGPSLTVTLGRHGWVGEVGSFVGTLRRTWLGVGAMASQ